MTALAAGGRALPGAGAPTGSGRGAFTPRRPRAYKTPWTAARVPPERGLGRRTIETRDGTRGLWP